MAQHIMLDLETLSTAPDAGIIQIGAQVFDPAAADDASVLIGDGICLNVDPQAVMDAGLRMEWSTLHWWLSQPDAFATLSAPGEGLLLSKSLIELSAFVNANGGRWAKIWANGAAFDPPILENAYRRCRLDIPWQYNNILDVRTMKWLAPSVGRVEPELAHNALSDCKAQALFVARAYRALKIAALSLDDFKPTHTHVKRGWDYQLIGEAEGQISSTPDKMAHLEEGDKLSIYRNEKGKLYWRMVPEFNDGRFSAKGSPAGEEERQETIAASSGTITETEPLAKSDLLLFYEKMELHDWWYMMSDDGSVYRRGEEADRALRREAASSVEKASLHAAFSSWKAGKGPQPERPD